MPDFRPFHENETPRKLEENAKRFVQYHRKIEDHKTKIDARRSDVADQIELAELTQDYQERNKLFAVQAIVEQDANKVNQIDEEYLANAKYFAQENLPELTDLAMHYATIAGKNIVEAEPKKSDDPMDELKTTVLIRPGIEKDLIEAARLRLVDQYCDDHGIQSIHDLTEEQKAEIQISPEWQAIGR